MSLLDSLDFDWDPHEKRWVENYDDLKEFKKKHGNCNVPAKYTVSLRQPNIIIDNLLQIRIILTL